MKLIFAVLYVSQTMGLTRCYKTEVFLHLLIKTPTPIFTGSAVALHCCKAHAKINRKMGNSTPCKIVTPKYFILKLCTRDYVGEFTCHANFRFDRCSEGFSPNRRTIATLWLSFRLSCPVLSLPFFSILCPGRTAELIFTLYGSNDVFPPKDGPLGG